MKLIPGIDAASDGAACQWSGAAATPLRAVVAVPVRDEALRVGACVTALAEQRDEWGRLLDPRSFEAVLLFNNCSDDSLAVACRAAAGTGLRLHCLEATLPAQVAHVGWARRLAMEAAALRLRRAGAPDGVVLTTDADSEVAPDWVFRNLRAIDAGADLVAGALLPEPSEFARLAEGVRHRHGRLTHYRRLLDRLVHLIDPDPADPWPRHSDEPGASLAIRLPIYERIGGLPPEPWNEDLSLVQAVRRIDGRIRHAPEVVVKTSCRLEGRAARGMAATLSRWQEDAPPDVADGIPAVVAVVRALRLRALVRQSYAARARAPAGPTERLGRALGLTPDEVRYLLRGPCLGLALERVLGRPGGHEPGTVPLGRLEAEIRAAECWLGLDRGAGRGDAAPRADSAPAALAGEAA